MRYSLFTVVAFAVLMMANPSYAATILAPTDGDVNTIELPFGVDRFGEYALFDADDSLDAGNALFIADNDRLVFEFLDPFNSWFVQNEAGENKALGLTPWFTLAFCPTRSSTCIGGTALGAIAGPAPNTEFLRMLNEAPQLLAVDVQVIPVPAAVWLFGSALGLLAWVRRRVA